jgi:hypothetical protein
VLAASRCAPAADERRLTATWPPIATARTASRFGRALSPARDYSGSNPVGDNALAGLLTCPRAPLPPEATNAASSTTKRFGSIRCGEWLPSWWIESLAPGVWRCTQ